MDSLLKTRDGIFTLLRPAHPDSVLPVLVDSPHSGRLYPLDFGASLTPEALACAEDQFIDLLIADAPRYGLTALWAEFPRTYIDVNRSEDDIDLALVPDWPRPVAQDGRSSAGIGLIRRLLRADEPLYNRLLTPEEVEHRLNAYYRPYHQVLEEALSDLQARFGFVFYVNIHSMPSLPGGPDIVLGDLDTKACDPTFILKIKNFFQSMNYHVKLNDPYKGAECLRRHGRPACGRQALQLEISKALYLNGNEINIKKFNLLKDHLRKFFEYMTFLFYKDLKPLAAD